MRTTQIVVVFLLCCFGMGGVGRLHAVESQVVIPSFAGDPHKKIGIAGMVGGGLGGAGFGLSYRPFSSLEIKGNIGSGFFFRSKGLETRYYISSAKWSPYLALGYHQWSFTGHSKVGRFILYHLNFLAARDFQIQNPKLNIYNTFLGLKYSLSPSLSFFYESGLFLKFNPFATIPTLGFGLQIYVL